MGDDGQGGPVDSTLVMSLNIYQTAFVFLEGGKAAAMSVVLFCDHRLDHPGAVSSCQIGGKLAHGNDDRNGDRQAVAPSPSNTPVAASGTGANESNGDISRSTRC